MPRVVRTGCAVTHSLMVLDRVPHPDVAHTQFGADTSYPVAEQQHPEPPSLLLSISHRFHYVFEEEVADQHAHSWLVRVLPVAVVVFEFRVGVEHLVAVVAKIDRCRDSLTFPQQELEPKPEEVVERMDQIRYLEAHIVGLVAVVAVAEPVVTMVGLVDWLEQFVLDAVVAAALVHMDMKEPKHTGSTDL